MNVPKVENWWVVAAAALAGLELFVVAGTWIERFSTEKVTLYQGVTVELPSQTGPLWGIVLGTGAIVLAAAAVLGGLYLRAKRPAQSRRLILAGLAPAALAGVVFFWFPPMWVVSLMAVAVMVRVSREALGAPVSA